MSQERGAQLVEADVTHRPAATTLLTVLLVGILPTSTGTALAVSGLASTGPAVGAQYPDSESGLPALRGADGALRAPTLLDLRAGTPGRPGGVRDARAEARAEPERLVERSVAAATRAAKPGAREYGAIPVLLGAMAVLGAATILRHRRGTLEQHAGSADALR